MRNFTLYIIVILLVAASCGKKEGKPKDSVQTPPVAVAKVTVASLAELLTQGKTPEFVTRLAQLTAIQVNDPVDASGRTLAMVAAGKGDLEALRAIVEKAARLDLQDRQGRTALHHGAGSVPVVTFLLERKVSPDPADAEGRTPVHAALVLGRCEVLGLLLGAGANRDARDRAGLTPLHLAAALPDLACLATLLDRKAQVNHADAAGLTPALAAARAGNLPALERLLQAGASLTKKTKRGDTALHLAAGAKTLDVLKFLVEKKRQFHDVRNGQGQTPLHAAALAGTTEAAAWLLSKKANVGAKDKEGRTPLHAGAMRGHLAVVKLLLEKKAQLDSPDFKKRTPLHLAIMNGKSEVANHLMTAGASVTLTDREGFAALHHAIIAGDEALAGGIIEKSGKVDVPTKDGWSALHLAAYRGQEKMVRLLLGKGANIKAKDRKGNHPWHLALDDTPPMFSGELSELKTELEGMTSGTPSTSGTPAVATSGVDVEALKAAIAWLEEERKSDAERRAGRLACARLLIEQGSDLEARDHSGRDGLQIAAASGMKDLFDLLRGKGLKGDKPDYRQRTLLYHAAIGGDLGIVKAAMELGFTEVAFKYKRETPLHVAAQHNRVEVVSFLLGKGADVKAKATNGDSVVLYAARNLAVEAAAALFAAGAPPVASAEEPEESTGPGAGPDDEGDWRPPSESGEDDMDYEEMPPEPGDEDGDGPKEAGAGGSEDRFETVKMDGTALDVVFSAAVKNTMGKKGRTPRAFVLLRRQLRFLELLFDKGTPVRAALEETPIPVLAVLAGHREIVELLMKKDDKFKEDLGEMMLGAAVMENHYGLARFFLDQEVKLEKGPHRDLLQAILSDDAISDRAAALDVFTRLLPSVEDVDAQDELGDTLMHHAVGTGSLEFVQAMMTSKPSLSKTNKNQETPVHVAVRNGMLKTVELLLTADPKAPEGERPFVPLAAGSGSVEVLQWLLKHGYKDVETGGGKVGGLFTAAKAGAWSAFQVLAEGRGEALRAVDDDGATLAHWAATGGSEKILKALQKAGLGFTTANRAGETPLHLAVKAGKSGAVAWLLKNGADPAAVDGAGKKAVDYADDALKPMFEGK